MGGAGTKPAPEPITCTCTAAFFIFSKPVEKGHAASLNALINQAELSAVVTEFLKARGYVVESAEFCNE